MNRRKIGNSGKRELNKIRMIQRQRLRQEVKGRKVRKEGGRENPGNSIKIKEARESG